MNAGIHKAFRADLRTAHEVGQFVELLPCINGTTRHANTTNVGCFIKDAKRAGAFQLIHKFDKLHAEAHIGFVRTKAAHCLRPTQTQEGFFAQIDAAHGLKEILGHLFKCVDHVILFYETHFAVDLRKFGLAISA